ncbi:Bile acid-CoA:amino acid N-acyltransferase [Armadillidium vulgare]|nr:Bile acid-CoA:amino acid N-acyltransferase [Armadillidium vulgare]
MQTGLIKTKFELLLNERIHSPSKIPTSDHEVARMHSYMMTITQSEAFQSTESYDKILKILSIFLHSVKKNYGYISCFRLN